MKKIYLFMCLCALVMGLALPAVSAAHEFIVKPTKFGAEAGTKVPYNVISAHVFMVTEEMEPAQFVKTFLTTESGTEELNFVPNEKGMTLDGSYEQPEGRAILSGHREGVVWTQTTTGWKQASKKGLKGVIKSGKYEKFCKTYLASSGSNKSGVAFDKSLGHKLEIIPMNDPYGLNVGDELEVKVLLDGKPVVIDQVLATYDGFSTQPNTYAYYTETYGKGQAKVKISKAGKWMVRVQYIIDQATEDYDTHVLRSVLVFDVK
ncbi:MAG: DUF4198 domain-containing protein [Desulfovibrio sp.]